MYFGSLENVVDLSSGRNTKAYIHNSTDRKTHIKYPPFKWGCRLVIIIYKPIPFPGISSLFSIAPNRWIPIAYQCNFVAQFPPKEGTPSSEDANSQRELILPRVKRRKEGFRVVNQAEFSSKPKVIAQSIEATSRAFGDGPRHLNHGQVTWTTPELAPPSPNYHTTPTGGRFSSRQI
ncbi:hypothetical protein TNCV_1005221 [Trichonephila clavipes]|nr:hypothetical protein TNCV_1005221 [Trichonephila clavipes]